MPTAIHQQGVKVLPRVMARVDINAIASTSQSLTVSKSTLPPLRARVYTPPNPSFSPPILRHPSSASSHQRQSSFSDKTNALPSFSARPRSSPSTPSPSGSAARLRPRAVLNPSTASTPTSHQNIAQALPPESAVARLHSPSSTGVSYFSSQPPHKRSRPPSVQVHPANRHNRLPSLLSLPASREVNAIDETTSSILPEVRPASPSSSRALYSNTATLSESVDTEGSLGVRLREESEEGERDARFERKIADLEIMNASLLAVNAKHIGEIRQLQRKLRDARLEYRMSGAALPLLEGASDAEDDEDTIEAAEPTWDILLQQDEKFGRLTSILTALLKQGREGLAYRPPKFEQEVYVVL